MLKDTKSLGNNKAPACESRGFVHKKRGVHFDTPPCFILDTGSTCSLIDSNVVEYFKDIVESIGDYSINGIDGTMHKVDVITLPFTFEGLTYKPKFCVKSLLDAFKGIEIESGIQVHGLLGTDFMLENKWIIDFNNLELRHD